MIRLTGRDLIVELAEPRHLAMNEEKRHAKAGPHEKREGEKFAKKGVVSLRGIERNADVAGQYPGVDPKSRCFPPLP